MGVVGEKKLIRLKSKDVHDESGVGLISLDLRLSEQTSEKKKE